MEIVIHLLSCSENSIFILMGVLKCHERLFPYQSSVIKTLKKPHYRDCRKNDEIGTIRNTFIK